MRLQVIHRDKRLAERQRDAFSGHQADQDAADQAGPRRRGDAVDVAGRDSRPLEGARDQGVEDLDMGAGGDLRHHAAVGGMGGDLAHQLVGENFAAAVRPQPHDRRRGLVAGRFNAEDAHRSPVRVAGIRVISVANPSRGAV